MTTVGIAAEQLLSILDRIENLTVEKKGIQDDIKDIYSEAKGNGYDVKAIRALVKIRAMETAARQEAEAILELYKSAVGIE